MICKATGAEGAPEQFAQLQAEIGQDRDVRLITDWLSGADMAALISAADIILSTHRSEGFGLVMAQGMGVRKAVIATGWSANLDFMTQANSMLIDYSLIPVKDPQELYGQGRWAEPDMEDAVAKLATLMADPRLRSRLGERAQADITALLDPERLAHQAAAWLGQDVVAARGAV